MPGTILKRTGKVNYQVISKDKILHRHIDQLIARVPDLGITPEVIEATSLRNTSQSEGRDGRDSIPRDSTDQVSRPSRQRKPPSWTKDYRM